MRRPTGSVAERVASRIAGTNRGNRDGRSIPDLAEQEGVTVAYACRLLPLTCLAPDIVEAILGGRLPEGVRLEDLVRPLPSGWAGQRRPLFGDKGG